jgi:hypothetical protein
LSRYQKTKKNQKNLPFFKFFFMLLANCCLVTASLTFSAIFAGLGDDFDNLGMSL